MAPKFVVTYKMHLVSGVVEKWDTRIFYRALYDLLTAVSKVHNVRWFSFCSRGIELQFLVTVFVARHWWPTCNIA